MADIEKVLQELPNISEMLYHMYKAETDKESISVRYDQYLAVCDAAELLKSQQAEIDRLKQGKLVDVDKLREKLGFSESCDKCKKDSWTCGRDTYFSERDFCERLDIAIEDLMQEGR